MGIDDRECHVRLLVLDAALGICQNMSNNDVDDNEDSYSEI